MRRRRLELRRREQRVAVCADGEKGGVTEVEQAGEADHDVQADRQQHEIARPRRMGDEGGAVCGVDGHHRKQERDDDQDAVDGRVSVTDPLPQVETPWRTAPAGSRGLTHFSGTRMPRRPVGLNTSTPMRMPKITTCVHLDPM